MNSGERSRSISRAVSTVGAWGSAPPVAARASQPKATGARRYPAPLHAAPRRGAEASFLERGHRIGHHLLEMALRLYPPVPRSRPGILPGWLVVSLPPSELFTGCMHTGHSLSIVYDQEFGATTGARATPA